MSSIRVLSLAVMFSLSLVVPGLSMPALMPQPRAQDDLAPRVAALETAVADLAATNADLAIRLAAVESALVVTPTVTPVAPTATVTPTTTTGQRPTPLPEASTPAPSAATANRNANLRAGPGTDFAVVGSVTQGDVLTVIGRNAASTWYEIEDATGEGGWIAAFLVTNAPEDLPVSEAQAPATEAAAAEAPTAEAPAAEASAPTATPAPPAPAAGQRLDVAFINPHYDCSRSDTNYEDLYRYFQVDFFINNTSDQTVEAPWVPSAWIITDGANERVATEMRLWCNRAGCPEQPDIPPGGSEGWTWITGRVNLNEWVKAVVWEYDGQTYRQEFADNAMNRAEWNYKRCGS